MRKISLYLINVNVSIWFSPKTWIKDTTVYGHGSCRPSRHFHFQCFQKCHIFEQISTDNIEMTSLSLAWVCVLSRKEKKKSSWSKQWTVLIIGTDMLLCVCRGNGKAALQGPVVWVCMCTSVYLSVWLLYDCLRAEESLLPGSERVKKDVDWCEEMCSWSRNRLQSNTKTKNTIQNSTLRFPPVFDPLTLYNRVSDF